MRLKFKNIHRTSDKKLFMSRMSLYLKKGSIKFHIIWRDDNDAPHTHPWRFKSFMIIPYKELLYVDLETDDTLNVSYNHLPFTRVIRECDIHHKTSLYRIFGIPIPAITIGIYSEKKQLCSFCTKLGYCQRNPPPDLHWGI